MYLTILLKLNLYYCKFGNFYVTFISRIFYFGIMSEFLYSRVSVHVFYKVYSDSLLARTLNWQGIQLTNISEKLEFVFYVKTDVSPLSMCMSKLCKQEL